MVINEFMASNLAAMTDVVRDLPDWIELLNTGETVLSLTRIRHREYHELMTWPGSCL